MIDVDKTLVLFVQLPSRERPTDPPPRPPGTALTPGYVPLQSSCPWFAILAAIAALINPQLVSKSIAPAGPLIAKATPP